MRPGIAGQVEIGQVGVRLKSAGGGQGDDGYAVGALIGAGCGGTGLAEIVGNPVGRHLVLAVHWPYHIEPKEQIVATVSTKDPKRHRNRRLEVRTTPEEREIIDRAVKAAGIDLTTFVITNLTVAARRVLADRTAFELDVEASQAWEAINKRPARRLAGLLKMMDRPSPFARG